MCELHKSSCLANRMIDVKFQGACGEYKINIYARRNIEKQMRRWSLGPWNLWHLLVFLYFFTDLFYYFFVESIHCDTNMKWLWGLLVAIDPCASIECPAASVCVLDLERRPHCRCGDTCPSDFQPVCGSDGRSYSSQCHLMQEACRSQRHLRILYKGLCESGTYLFVLFRARPFKWLYCCILPSSRKSYPGLIKTSSTRL